MGFTTVATIPAASGGRAATITVQRRRTDGRHGCLRILTQIEGDERPDRTDVTIGSELADVLVAAIKTAAKG